MTQDAGPDRPRSSLVRPIGRLLSGVALVGLLAGCSTAGHLATSGHQAGPTNSAPKTAQSAPTAPPPTTAPPGKFQATKADWSAIQDLLDRRARAVMAGNLVGFLSTVDRRNTGLLSAQRTLFANLQALPVASIRYTMQDLALTPADIPGRDPVLSPPVVEHVYLRGTDARPVGNEPHDTFVRRAGRWLLAAESDDASAGRSVQSRPWAGQRITVVRRGHLIVVVDASHADQAAPLADRVTSDLASLAQTLHQQVQDRVLVDATSSGKVSRMNTVTRAEAAAVTFPVSAENANGQPSGLAGWRIKINPQEIDQLISDQVVLRHELTHFVLRRLNEGNPTWLTEGVANYVGYLPEVIPHFRVDGNLYAKLMAPPHQLPNSGVFDLYPSVNYLVGQAAVTYLVEHYGMDKLLQLMRGYRATGQPLADSATPRLLQRIYGITQGQLVNGTYSLLSQLDH